MREKLLKGRVGQKLGKKQARVKRSGNCGKREVSRNHSVWKKMMGKKVGKLELRKVSTEESEGVLREMGGKRRSKG